MADKDLEKRLQALEKSVKAAESRAKAAEARADALEREHKELKAHSRARVAELKAENRTLNSMRDLHDGPQNPYGEDSSAKYEALKRATVKTKDGMRHYFSELPSFVNGHYYPAGSMISIPADQDPSVTWKPVKVGGKDPKTGALVFLLLEQEEAEVEADPSQQVESGEVVSNTELNDKAARGRAKAAQRGAGAPPAPTPPQRPGAQEPELPEGDAGEPESTEPRAADTDVG